jgi:hypothetical protein
VVVLHVAEDEPADPGIPDRTFGKSKSRAELFDVLIVARDINKGRPPNFPAHARSVIHRA